MQVQLACSAPILTVLFLYLGGCACQAFIHFLGGLLGFAFFAWPLCQRPGSEVGPSPSARFPSGPHCHPAAELSSPFHSVGEEPRLAHTESLQRSQAACGLEPLSYVWVV